jgi:hypothetical protein
MNWGRLEGGWVNAKQQIICRRRREEISATSLRKERRWPVAVFVNQIPVFIGEINNRSLWIWEFEASARQDLEGKFLRTTV